MCETDDAKLSSTTLSANNLTVHRRCPAGASEQARAISRASTATSATFQAGPSREALQSNNARAWMNFLAGVFPLRVMLPILYVPGLLM